MDAASEAARALLAELIETTVFVRGEDEPFVSPGTHLLKQSGWLMDFRRIALRSAALRACATLFQRDFPPAAPLQICGLEVAAIPIVAGIAAHSARDGREFNAFFIRKSRKKDGLLRMVEGTIEPETPIVLIDDILNSGKTFIRQIEVLEELGHRVRAIWCLLRFRDLDFYEYFHNKGIAIHSLFTLDDFAGALPVKNLVKKEPARPQPPPLVRRWKFAAAGANLSYVVPKSRPCLDDAADGRLYFGTDGGFFYAISQATGEEVWRYKVGHHAKGKSIFSSPVLGSIDAPQDTVYFGAYDGNVYALDAAGGDRRWINFEADWVGSSPCLAEDLGLLFVGTEYGLPNERGGIVALDARTGEKRWDARMPAYTHCSPLYLPGRRQVAIGSNDGAVRLFDAETGALQWIYPTGEPTPEALRKGFSPFDIKDACGYAPALDLLFVGNQEGRMFALSRGDGAPRWSFKAEFAFWSRPLVHETAAGETYVYGSSLDKFVYAFHAATGELAWKHGLGARVFCAPCLWRHAGRDLLLVGANTGRLTALDPLSGKEEWFLTLPERIVNPPVYNPRSETLFVPTFANEVYAFDAAVPATGTEEGESRRSRELAL